MKNLLFFLLLVPFALSAQTDTVATFPIRDGKVVYESIVDVKGVKKENIFSASQKWIADSFRNGKSVIQSENKDSGQIIGNANTTVTAKSNSWIITAYTFDIKFSIQITCKDEKYRIRFYDISTTNLAAGLVSSPLDMPLESFGDTMKIKKLKGKQLQRANNTIYAINDEFTLLMNSFNSSVKKSNDDNF